MTEDKKPSSKDSTPSQPEEFEFEPLHEDAHPQVEESPRPTSKNSPAADSESVPDLSAPLDGMPTKPSSFAEWLARNKTLALFFGFVVIGGLMYGISMLRNRDTGGDNGENNPPPAAIDEIPVNVVEARLGRFQDSIEAVGTLKGEAEIELRFEVEGKIEAMNVQEGDRVKRGMIIAKLNDRDASLKVEQARVELEQMEKLYVLGGASKTKIRETQLKLDLAQSELDKTYLKASRDGIIGDKAADVGEYVTPQRKIATLVAIRKVVVKVGIIEKQVDKVFPGQKILSTVDAYPGNVFEGVIESISPIVIGDSKTLEMTASIPNPDSLLLPGMFARAKIITYEATEAISVPNDALVKTPGGFQVFVVNKENVAEARDVEVGYVATEYTQVLSGLSPGEVVVVQKPPELESGKKVKIIEVQNN